jgi:hypothetical protein
MIIRLSASRFLEGIGRDTTGTARLWRRNRSRAGQVVEDAVILGF